MLEAGRGEAGHCFRIAIMLEAGRGEAGHCFRCIQKKVEADRFDLCIKLIDC